MKAPYKVDLPRQLAICEANYLRMSKLLPSMATEDSRVLAISGHHVESQGEVQVLFEIEERAPYTTSILVKVNAGVDNTSLVDRALAMPPLRVRLYHDASMAEIVSWQHHRRIKPRYDYPNEYMYQQDEKAQLNQFLAEWLGHCLAHGHDVQDVIDLAG